MANTVAGRAALSLKTFIVENKVALAAGFVAGVVIGLILCAL